MNSGQAFAAFGSCQNDVNKKRARLMSLARLLFRCVAVV